MFLLLSQLSHAIDCSAVIRRLKSREECFAEAKSCYAQSPSPCHVADCKRIEARCSDLPSELSLQRERERKQRNRSYNAPSNANAEVCGLLSKYNEKAAAYYIFSLQMGMVYSGMTKQQVRDATKSMADNTDTISQFPQQKTVMEEMYILNRQIQTALGCP